MPVALVLLQPRPTVGSEEEPYSKMQSVSKLPKHIVAPENGVALFADFEHSEAPKGPIPVYLINRSGKDIQLKAQDNDVYLKLEFQQQDGTWRRAQSHMDSFCGNSYMSPPLLKNGTFLRIPGYQSAKGSKETVRYKLYNQTIALESNTGNGVVSDSDVQAAATDSMAIRTGDFELVSQIARGTLGSKKPQHVLGDYRRVAIYQLGSGRFDSDAAKKVLLEIVVKNEPEYADLARSELLALQKSQKNPAK